MGAGSGQVRAGIRGRLGTKPVDLTEVGRARAEPCWVEMGPTGVGGEGWGRAVGGADEGRTLGERAGSRPLTVASRYCTVPQSLTARLKRSSRYCKEEGAEGSWSPGQILARGSRPLRSFTRPLGFCPLSRGQLCSLHSCRWEPLPSAHIPTVRAHLCTPTISMPVPTACVYTCPPPPTHTHSWPTVISLDFNHFTHCLREVL